MSRIVDLIAKLCPDGVPYRRLAAVARIRNGKDYKAFAAGNVPVYGTGGIMARIDTAAHTGPSVLIPRKGSIDKLYFIDEPFWTVDTIFYTEIDASVIAPKFFYYFLATRHLEELNQAGGIPSLTQSVLNEIRVPVPPLDVQREIVNALDAFTELEAELEAELAARRRQYEHYRDSLLEFGKGERVQWMTIGDLGTLARGRRFTKDDVVSDGLGSIHYGEIYTQYGTWATEIVSRVRTELAPRLRFARTGDVVIAAVGETVEEVCKAVAWLGEEDVAVHDDCFIFRHSMNPKFVSYCLQTSTFHAEKAKHVARAKVKRVSSEGLARLSIPVPPLKEQDRIVGILDKFDALVNDRSIGLPAELSARRQQYEHYRGRLLTFSEAA